MNDDQDRGHVSVTWKRFRGNNFSKNSKSDPAEPLAAVAQEFAVEGELLIREEDPLELL